MKINYGNELLSYNSAINHRLLQLLKPLRERYNVNYFYYTRYSKNKTFIICTNLEFLRKAIEFKKMNEEHIILRDLSNLKENQQRKMIWTGVPREKSHVMLHNCDIWNGYSIIQKNKTGIEHWGFATQRENDRIVDSYLNESNIFNKFMLYFRDNANDLINNERAEGLPITNFRISAPTEEEQEASPFLNKFKRYYINNHTYFTPREIECLYWLSKGKTIEMTAEILHLSPRTVKEYISNVKERMGCNTFFQLGMIYQSLDLNS
jgi:DNA-binding CsgD family transcriptional regulator